MCRHNPTGYISPTITAKSLYYLADFRDICWNITVVKIATFTLKILWKYWNITWIYGFFKLSIGIFWKINAFNLTSDFSLSRIDNLAYSRCRYSKFGGDFSHWQSLFTENKYFILINTLRSAKDFSFSFCSFQASLGSFLNSDFLLPCQCCHNRYNRISENPARRDELFGVWMPFNVWDSEWFYWNIHCGKQWYT